MDIMANESQANIEAKLEYTQSKRISGNAPYGKLNFSYWQFMEA